MLIRSSLISVAVLSLALSASAQQPPVKVAVISLQGALVGTKDGQKASQELETKFFAPKRKEFEARQAELAGLQDQYNKGGNLMSDEKRNQLARDIDEKKKRLDRDMQDAQESLNAEQQRVLQGLGQRLMAVIEKYAKDNGYTMVLDDSNPSTPILYASMGIDITQDIISLYDKSPTPAGAPATPAKPGTAAPKPGSTGPGAAANVPPAVPKP